MIVLASIPLYLAIATLIRPSLRDAIKEKFNRGALSQQFLVETVIGVQTVKAAAVEPVDAGAMEERLAAYVRTAFDATMLSAMGQNALQYVQKLTTALLLLFGAKAVLDKELSVGELIAFNIRQPGDAAEPSPVPAFGRISSRCRFRRTPWRRAQPSARAAPRHQPYAAAAQGYDRLPQRYLPLYAGHSDVLKGISINIRPGEVIGIVGPSGSGKIHADQTGATSVHAQ